MTSKLTTMKEAVAAIEKSSGKGSHSFADKVLDFPRLTTGILPLDVGLGGGIPLGAVSMFYGPEGSGKTSLTFRCIAQFQKRFPKKAVVFMDIERALDSKFAAKHGVDTSKLHVFTPTTAEEAADQAKEIALAEDAGMVVVDSIAALTAIPQLEKSAEQVVVAGAAKPSTQMLRNIHAGIVEHSKVKDRLTAIYVNQTRNKIGFVMGNPEHTPGPVIANYQAFLKLRLSKRDILKEKIAAVPIYAENTARISKKKFPALRQEMKWETILYPYEQGGKQYKPTETNSLKHLELMLDDLGWATKDKSGWINWHGEVFPTKGALMEAALANYDDTVHDLVVEYLKTYEGTDEDL